MSIKVESSRAQCIVRQVERKVGLCASGRPLQQALAEQGDSVSRSPQRYLQGLDQCSMVRPLRSDQGVGYGSPLGGMSR